MMLTLHRLDEFQPGDVILAADGTPLDPPFEVEYVGPDALTIYRPFSAVEWRLYADNVAMGMSVEREIEPDLYDFPLGPPKPLPQVSPLRDWRKLPPVSNGYTRIPDRLIEGGMGGHVPKAWVRMVRCDTCGNEITSLGIGYHRQNTGH